MEVEINMKTEMGKVLEGCEIGGEQKGSRKREPWLVCLH